MNRKQKIIVSITGIFIVLLALVGLTYAYFLTRITGNENDKSISVTTANLELVYGNDDGSIIGDGELIEPDTTFETKTFTVTNNGNATVDNYAVILEDVKTYYNQAFTDENNTPIAAGTQVAFKRPEDFEIKITCKSNVNGNTCDGYTGTLPLMKSTDNTETYITNGIFLTNSIEKDETQTYSVVLTYKEANTNQSDDMNKGLQGKFNIIDANNTVDITGTVSGHTVGESVVTNSVRRESQINSDGSYKIVGLEADIHSIKLSKIVDEEEQLTEIGKISIVKGNEANVGTTTHNDVTIPEITITDASRNADVNIDKTNTNITLGEKIYVFENPYNEGTLAYKILDSANVAANTANSDRTSANAITKYGLVNNVKYKQEVKHIKGETSSRDCVAAKYYDNLEYNEETGKWNLTGYHECNSYSDTECNGNLIGKYLYNIEGNEKAPEGTNITTYYKVDDNYPLYYNCNYNEEDEDGDGEADIWECYDCPQYIATKYTIESYSVPELSNVEKTLRKTHDDDGDTYYFRGASDDNYVNFAGMCWKIVRINGDRSIKIILDDQNTTCDSETYNGNSIYGPSTYPYNMEPDENLNYLYDITGPMNFSGSDTWLSTKISNFYKKNINDYLLKDNWCWESKETTSLSKYNSLKCYGTKQNGYAATITKSELDYLGGPDFSYLFSKYELDYYYDEWKKNYNISYDFESVNVGFTLLSSQLGSDNVLTTRGSFWTDGSIGNSGISHGRIAINLKAGIEATGTGTYKDPYVIK